ncbi:MAG: hypothetical protein IH986_08950 [Planctomycetes bacterium]|nr:hypothetical protein [Planctomycetota bacterium]
MKDGRLALLENPQRTVQDCERFLNDGRTVLRELGEHDYHYRVSAHEGAFDFLPSVRLGKMVAAALNGSVVSPIFDWQGRYVPSSEAYQVTLKIFEAFYRDVLEQGALPVIVIFGDKNDQEDAKRGKPRRYKVLLEAFVERGYMVIDTMEALEAAYDRYSLANLMVDWGHYSVVANSLTARHIAEKIDAWGLSEPEVRARLIHEARQRMGGTPDY